MCGYVPPAQNSFKPNIMSRYVNDGTGEVIILNDNVERIEILNKGSYTREDRVGQKAKQPASTLPPPPATVMSQTLIPAKPIPASAIKTPAEIAATPKAAVTAALPVLPVPATSGGVAPSDIVTP